MGKIDLDPRITNIRKSWGEGYNSLEGCSHDSSDDKIDPKIDSKNVTLNRMNLMDSPMPKPSSDNPGVDKGFWAKANPQMDTVGEGKLTRNCKDR